MIKKFTLFLFAAIALTLNANADDNLTFNWAHSVDGYSEGGDQVIGGVKGTDGNLFILNEFGTNTDQSAMNVGVDGEKLYDHSGEELVEGGSYYGNSMNGNVMLQNVDPTTGKINWFAYTKKGYLYANNSYIAAAPDGGVVMVLKMRAWVEQAGLNNLIEFVDATGQSTTVADMHTLSGEYRYVVLKVSSEGLLEWSRVIWGKAVLANEKIDENYKSALTYNAKDVIDAYGIDVDTDGNIYICGRFRTSIYFKKSDGSVVSHDAKNNKDYNGDSQKVMGDLFLVKLNKNGFYENSLVSESTAQLAFFDNVVYNDGNLYLNGRVTGDGTEYNIGGKVVNASTTLQTVFIASVNASDMSVNYVNTLTSSKGTAATSFVVQNKNVQFVNGSVYFTGLLRGAWTKAGETEPFADSKANMLKGYVLKVDPATGDIQQSYVRTDGGIGGFFGVWVGENNTYLHGYDMKASAILTKISNDTFTKVDEYNICTYGMVASCGSPIIDGENFVMINRGGKANNYTNSASFYGSETKFENLACWGNVFYSYKINDSAAE